MKLPFTIEDFYGCKITVEPLMASPGPVVDLEFNDDSDDFVRLEPEQALKLAEAIKAAAEARF